MERNHLEQLLRANGLNADANDDDIRSMLISASYNDTEVEAALSTLKGPKHDKQSETIQAGGNKKLFRSGERLNPAEISQLLGVNVVVNEVIIAEAFNRRLSSLQSLLLWVICAMIFALAGMGYMYKQKSGLFHPAMAEISFEE